MRRRILLTLLIAIACGARALAEDWPRWGGPRGDATWQGPQLPESWPEKGLPVAWRKAIGGGCGGVSQADGRVFLMDRQVEPREAERLLSYDSRSGALLWADSYPVA